MPAESWASSPAARKRMQANRGRDTGIEIAIRRELHRRGLRFFVHRRPLTGVRRTVDIVFPRTTVAVFVDGCFWHGCPLHHTIAKTNAGFWADKVRRNQERDRETNAIFVAAGWTVVRVWEHTSPTDAADQISLAIASPRN